MITPEAITQINEVFYTHYPEERGRYWSGCNYHINQGSNEHEPVGTAQSIHDCGVCSDYSQCKMKKKHPTWFYCKEIGEELDIYFNELFRSKHDQL